MRLAWGTSPKTALEVDEELTLSSPNMSPGFPGMAEQLSAIALTSVCLHVDTEPLRVLIGTSDEALSDLVFLCEETPGDDSMPKENTEGRLTEALSQPVLTSTQRASADDPGHLAHRSRSSLPAFPIRQRSKQPDLSTPAQHCNPTLCNGYNATQPPPHELQDPGHYISSL